MRAPKTLLAAAASLLLARPAAAQDGDWPMWRHDAQRTAYQPMPAAIDVAAEVWTLPVGGRMSPSEVLVLDGEGTVPPRVVVLRGGRAVAYAGGTLLWSTAPLTIERLVGIADFGGDGRTEVVASGLAAGVFLLDSTTGAVLWNWRPTDGARLGRAAVLDVDGDSAPDLYLPDDGASRSGLGTGRVLRFPLGPLAPTEIALSSESVTYWNGRYDVFADLDGDGSPELLVPSHDRIHVFDPRTGDELLASNTIDELPWGTGELWVGDLDADGAPEVVLCTNFRADVVPDPRRITVFEMGGDELVERWTRAFPPLGNHISAQPVALDLVAELPGLELATSYFDPESEAWRTIIVPGTSPDGAELATVDGQYVCGVLEPPATSSSGALALCTADRIRPPAVSSVSVASFSGASAVPSLAALGGALGPLPGSETLLVAATASGGPTLLATEDVDGDGAPDGLALVDPTTGARRARAESSLSTAIASVTSAGPDGHLFAASWSNGAVGIYDSDLGLLNPSGLSSSDPATVVPNAFAGLAATTCRVTPEGTVFTLPDARGVLGAYLVESGASPLLVWSAAGATQAAGSVALLADDSDDLTLLYSAMAGGEPPDRLILQPLRAGASPTSISVTDDPYAWQTPGPAVLLDAAGLPSRYVTVLGSLARNASETVSISLPGGEVAWRRPNPFGGAQALSIVERLSGDLELVHLDPYRLAVLSPESGELLRDAPATTLGIVAVSDILGDGEPELLVSGAYDGGPALYDWTATRLWRGPPSSYAFDAPLHLGVDPPTVLVSPAMTPDWYLLSALTGEVVSTGTLASGEAFASVEEALARGAVPGVLGPAVAVAEISPAAGPAFVVGSSDGFLYALSARDGALVWSLGLRAAVSTPVLCDIDGDGASEILVSAGDGAVHVVDEATLASPGAVYDTDGSFLATSDDEDLDELHVPAPYGCNWSSVPGATDYEHTLVREDELVVVPWTPTAGATSVALRDVRLEPGRRYYSAVRARGGAAGDLVSVESRSDGLLVSDITDPVVTLEASTPRIFLDGSEPSAVDLEAGFDDEFGLDVVSVAVESDTSAIPLFSQVRPGQTASWSGAWDGAAGAGGERVDPGEYIIVAEAQDVAGHAARVEAPLLVCARPGEGPGCEEAEDGGVDGGSDARPDGDSDGTVGHWRARGGGCSCRAGGGSQGPGLWGLLGLGLAAFLRPRKRH